MKIVLDTSVIISALLKNSTSRIIISLAPFQFYTPEDAVKEILKYKGEIMKRSNYNLEEFNFLLDGLLEKIILVKNRNLKSYFKEAEEIMKEIDIQDSPFIACALAIEANGILSFDKHFPKQKIIRIFTIKELLEYM